MSSDMYKSRSDIRHYYYTDKYIISDTKTYNLGTFNIPEYLDTDEKQKSIKSSSVFAFEKISQNYISNELITFINEINDPINLVEVEMPTQQLPSLVAMNPSSIVHIFYRNIHLNYIITLVNEIDNPSDLTVEYLRRNKLYLLNERGLNLLDAILANIESNKIRNGKDVFAGEL